METCHRPSLRRKKPSRMGFTLVEAICATLIVAMGAVAIMVSAASGTRVNSASEKLTQATFLAQEVREWTLSLPFTDPDDADEGNPPGPDGSDPQSFVDDLDDLMDVVYSPPRDGRGMAISDMNSWSQQIDIEWRDPSDLTTAVAAGTSEIVYLEVTVLYDGVQVMQTGWLVAERN